MSEATVADFIRDRSDEIERLRLLFGFSDREAAHFCELFGGKAEAEKENGRDCLGQG